MKERRLDRSDLLALGLLGLLCLAFLWQVALAGRILAGPDAFSYFYPMYDYAGERLRQGQLPLWNPHLFLGAPFLANPQAGVLYPLHWPLLWLSSPGMAGASLTLHYGLLLAGSYLFLRQGLRLGRTGAIAGALTLGLGGLAGSQAEHFNQVEALAWLPIQALLLEGALRRGEVGGVRAPRVGLSLAGSSLVAGLQLLAGHAQAAYVAQATLAAYAVTRAMGDGSRRERARLTAFGLGFVGLSAVLGAALAGAQLLPTGELSRLSVRGGGLPYRQAVSFSFAPRTWLLGLLPHYGSEDVFSEYTAYIGVSGLLLAGAGALRSSRRLSAGQALVALGFFLALGAYNPLYYVLYKIVPGISLFRAPARWLIASAFGLSMLVALGVDALAAEALHLARTWRSLRWVALAGAMIAAAWLLARPSPQPVTIALWAGALGGSLLLAAWRWRPGRQWGLLGLLILELFLASRRLPYAEATATSVYFADRRAAQVIRAAGGLGRFLSVSAGGFDAGDMAELESLLGENLTAVGRYALVVNSKSQELIARNLALHAGLYAVDGYDGGVLPTAEFVRFQTLFLPTEEVATDGRLTEHLHDVPAERLLALASVRYVLGDRVQDLWLGGVYYDLGTPLRPSGTVSTLAVPEFPTTAIGLVVRPGDGVGHFTIQAVGSTGGSFYIAAAPSGVIASSAGERLEGRPVEGRQGLYHLVLPLPSAVYLGALRLQGDGASEAAAVSLLNLDSAAGVPVQLGQARGLTAIHYGDVKLYELSETLPRAYFSPCGMSAGSPEEALALMHQQGWDARESTVVVGDGSACDGVALAREVTVTGYEPERVRLRVAAPSDGYVVLTDSYSPGWHVTVDGRPAPLLRANYLFRAVPVAAGRHEVEFVYRPRSLRIGVALSVAGLLAIALLAAVSAFLPPRRASG